MSCGVIQCLTVVSVFLVAMTTHQRHQAGATWPPAGPSGGMPMYECCCLDNPACGGCFVCRQNVYTCYCDTCSCYRGWARWWRWGWRDDMMICSCYSADRLLGRPPSMINQLEENSRDHDNDGKSIVFAERRPVSHPRSYPSPSLMLLYTYCIYHTYTGTMRGRDIYHRPNTSQQLKTRSTDGNDFSVEQPNPNASHP